MKITLIISTFFALATVSKAQIVKVKDLVTLQPLEMVIITSSDPNNYVITDTKGEAKIATLRGESSLSVRLVGYRNEVVNYSQLESNNFQIYLTEDNISLQTIVVSAARWKQSKRDVPSKISSINSKEVLLHNPQTAADFLSLSGDVYIQKSQLGGGSPMIRGFATNRVLLTVDGIRMNTAIFRSGNLQNVISLDPLSIEKAEVLFGPGSVTYGSDAIAGIMSFYTLTPQSERINKIKGNILTRWSSANTEKTGHFDLDYGFKKCGLLTSVTYTDYDDLKMGSNGPEEYLRSEHVATINGFDEILVNPDSRIQLHTGYSQLNLMQKLRLNPNNRWEFTYALHFSTTSNYNRYDRLINYRNGKPRSAEWYYGPQIWLMNNLNVSYSREAAFYDKLNIILAHQFFKESRHNRDFGKIIKYNRTEKVNAYSFNLDFEKTIDKKQIVSYGVDLLHNKINSAGIDENVQTGKSIAGPSRYPDGSGWNSLAAFLTHRYKLNHKLNLQAGVRYNHFLLDAAFDSSFISFPFTSLSLNTGALTGSMGMIYSPLNSLQFSTNFSTGFRSPNIDDIGKVFDSTPGIVIVPNPKLKPEYIYNIDFNISKTFGSILKVDATLFYSHLTDAMIRSNYLFNGQDSIIFEGEMSQVQAIQNAANAYVWGVQAGVEFKFCNSLNLSSHFNYQKGKEKLEDGSKAPLRHAAPSFGTTHITYTIKHFKADFYAAYNSKISNSELAPEEQGKSYIYAIDKNGKPYSPSWMTLNLKTLLTITQSFTASIGIENILNKRYRPYSSGIVSPGRNLIVSLKTSF
jgi:hemoglobin/transferrin/lactoferrin receptor protein